MPSLELYPLDDCGSFAWLLGPADPMSRASSAIVLGAGTVLVDPVEADGLDEQLSPLPPVIGVVTLLDRHQRDAAAIAARLGVAASHAARRWAAPAWTWPASRSGR